MAGVSICLGKKREGGGEKTEKREASRASPLCSGHIRQPPLPGSHPEAPTTAGSDLPYTMDAVGWPADEIAVHPHFSRSFGDCVVRANVRRPSPPSFPHQPSPLGHPASIPRRPAPATDTSFLLPTSPQRALRLCAIPNASLVGGTSLVPPAAPLHLELLSIPTHGY